jgi:hypothetical protein
MNVGKSIAVGGAILILGPLFGLLGTVVGMLQTFKALTIYEPESKEVAAGIDVALLTTQLGLIAGLLGSLFFVVALFYFKYRARWFFWLWMASATLNLLAFPIGTFIGVCLVVFLILIRDEFFQTNPRSEQGDLGNADKPHS